MYIYRSEHMVILLLRLHTATLNMLFKFLDNTENQVVFQTQLTVLPLQN